MRPIEYTEFEGKIISVTDKAARIRFVIEFDDATSETKTEWFPRSQFSSDTNIDSLPLYTLVTLRVQKWIARDKGVIE